MSQESDFYIEIENVPEDKEEDILAYELPESEQNLIKLSSNGYIESAPGTITLSFYARWWEWSDDLSALSEMFPDIVIKLTIKNDEFEDGILREHYKNGESFFTPEKIYNVITIDGASGVITGIGFKDKGGVASELKRIAEHYRLDADFNRFTAVDDIIDLACWQSEYNGCVDVHVIKMEVH